MGKPTGFKEWSRQMPDRRPVEARVADWREIYQARDAEASRKQGGRCMDCGVPFCQQGCPLGNLIPDWNDLVYRDRWQAAWRALASTNNFPEFTGRLCPAPCEAACTLSINEKPVTIEQIEKEIVERAFAEGWVKAQPPRHRTGSRVAVVGSGPAGLAAAAQLNRAGHTVTVYERSDRVGGLLRYGIPDFKLEKWVIDRRVALLEEEGVVFQTGVEVGAALPWPELAAQHDAVLVAIGAGVARDLEVPGRELAGVHLAMDFLEAQNRVVAGDAPRSPLSAEGKHVIILGGGDTGSDCLGTSLRHGAASVRQIELFPEPPTARGARNPWPQWPLVFTTSTSQEEGGDRKYALRTTHLEGEQGVLKRLHAVRVALITEGGRTRLVDVPGSEEVYEVDLLILAMGFVHPAAASLAAQLGMTLDGRGNLAVDDAFRTSVPRVYAAGDAHRGASLIVWAISEGREAARAIDSDLLHAPPRLPTRGQDQPFGGR